MAVFLGFLAVFFLLAVFAVTLLYWYEVGNSPCEDIPAASWSPRPVIRLWADAAYAFLMLALALPLDPILRRTEKKDKTPDHDDLPPVLLIHGLYHNPTGWVYLRRHLSKAGFRKIHTFGYSSRNAAIPGITDKLETAIAAIERQYPGRKPLLVGHSLGGLLIRNWLANAENQPRALGALTLGAPHRGSKVAALAFGKLGRSLLPTNSFFADLARTEAPASIPCVSLAAEADTMVLPQQCLVPVTKGWELRLTPYATHAGLMVKGAVLRMAVWELHRMAAMNSGIADGTPPEAPAADAATEADRPGTQPAPVPSAAPLPEAAPLATETPKEADTTTPSAAALTEAEKAPAAPENGKAGAAKPAAGKATGRSTKAAKKAARK